MSRFDVHEIGSEVEATAGALDGCELCGHCMVLLRSRASGAVACRAAHRGDSTPWDVFLQQATATFAGPRDTDEHER